MFSEVTRRQIQRFRSIRRAWVSLWILALLYIVSLFSEHVANDRPLLLGYNGHLFFPTVKFYSGQTFGGPYRTEADYTALRGNPDFKAKGGWMILPLISSDPLHSHLDLPGNPPQPPSWEHWLGTDNSARDVLARLLYGFRSSMSFALCLACIGTFFGIIVGGIQGYAGGKTDILGQRLIEIWSALPFLYVVILLGSIYGQGFGILLVVFTLFNWIGLSYYMRGEFFRLKNQAFVQAAQAMGAGHVRIIFRHILPNALNPVITLLPFSLVGYISSLTALDFLGFGLPPPAPSWGEMLQEGLAYLYAPWLAISAVTALFATLLLASFIGEGARAAFDPKSSGLIK
ncbi:MAG: ABC transporter permease [Methylacidiphilales bacterium]|nr:ABC transporter permease [Candidatus Methylacidiphilales bacterium]